MSVREAGKLPVVLGWSTGQDGWGGDMNRNLALLSTLAQLTIESVTATEPPSTAVEWEVYFIANNPTGPWAGQGGKLAILVAEAWEFVTPAYGWEARLRDTEAFIWWNGEQWLDRGTGEPADGGDPSGLPIGQKVLYSRPGSPGPGEKFVVPIDQPLLLATGAAGSLAYCETPSAVSAFYRILRNSTEVGRIVFAAGSYAGTFSVASSVTFGVGDRLIIVAPADTPAGLSDVSLSLRLLFTGV